MKTVPSAPVAPAGYGGSGTGGGGGGGGFLGGGGGAGGLEGEHSGSGGGAGTTFTSQLVTIGTYGIDTTATQHVTYHPWGGGHLDPSVDFQTPPTGQPTARGRWSGGAHYCLDSDGYTKSCVGPVKYGEPIDTSAAGLGIVPGHRDQPSRHHRQRGHRLQRSRAQRGRERCRARAWSDSAQRASVLHRAEPQRQD